MTGFSIINLALRLFQYPNCVTALHLYGHARAIGDLPEAALCSSFARSLYKKATAGEPH
jgi:hypothetical protein